MLSLTFENFRNLVDATWEPPEGRVLLLGDNGSGKTSLLEALYVVATTKSFRASQIGECRRHGQTSFRLACEVDRQHLVLGQNESGRFRTLNGKDSSLADYLAVLPVVAWTTAERELLTGPPAGRRRFLDRGLIAERPAFLGALQRYGQALAQKRALLASRRRELDSWNELLARAGHDMARLRSDHAEHVAAALSVVLARANFAFPPIEIHYRPNPPAALAGEEDLRRALELAAPEELRRRQPLVGPHRDDLVVQWGDSDLRRVASAGERKALGLALLVAQVEVLEAAGRRPTLLLDDADTELDRHALARVWRLLGERRVFASSNRAEVWSDLPMEGRFELRDGGLH
jgi:DNA replication and repair protein RecF